MKKQDYPTIQLDVGYYGKNQKIDYFIARCVLWAERLNDERGSISLKISRGDRHRLTKEISNNEEIFIGEFRWKGEELVVARFNLGASAIWGYYKDRYGLALCHLANLDGDWDTLKDLADNNLAFATVLKMKKLLKLISRYPGTAKIGRALEEAEDFFIEHAERVKQRQIEHGYSP